MVETPGTAPGSDPLIASAFMFIVPKDSSKVGPQAHNFNRYSNGLGRKRGKPRKFRVKCA